MADLSLYVGILGNVISILVFSSPITTFWRVVKKKSTEGFKGIPYVTTLLSTSMWTYYGLLKPEVLVVTVNGAGSALQAVYVALFIAYAPRDTKVRIAKLAGLLNVAALGTVVAVTFFALHGSLRLTVIGVMCAGLTVGMYASPLSAMRMVVKTKSVEFMPFFLSFFLFLNGGVWSVYSFLVKDFYIGVPNAIGFILGTAQLILYAMYRKKTPQTTKEETDVDEEDGSAHLVRRIEMQGFGEVKEKANGFQHRNLKKGSSLPNSVMTTSRQHSFNKIVKAHSTTPYELHSNLQQLQM